LDPEIVTIDPESVKFARVEGQRPQWRHPLQRQTQLGPSLNSPPFTRIAARPTPLLDLIQGRRR